MRNWSEIKAIAYSVEHLFKNVFLGLSVLEVIKNEKLISSANRVGRTLQQGLLELKDRYVHDDCMI